MLTDFMRKLKEFEGGSRKQYIKIKGFSQKT